MTLFKSHKEKVLRDFYENGIPGMKFVWGIKSGDDLGCGREASIYSMNDFDITYLEREKKYNLSVETIYDFDSLNDSYNYLNGILIAFTKWMKDNHYSTDYKPCMYDLFEQGVNIHTPFDSLEEAYGVFKTLVIGYTQNNRIEKFV